MLALLFAIAFGGLACKGTEAPEPNADITAIRQLIEIWETSIEGSNGEALAALFDAAYWPQSRSFFAIANHGGHELRVTEVSIDVGVQGEHAEAFFEFRNFTVAYSWGVTWQLNKGSGWRIVDEDWTAR